MHEKESRHMARARLLRIGAIYGLVLLAGLTVFVVNLALHLR